MVLFLLVAMKFLHGEALQVRFQIQFTELFHTLTGTINTIVSDMRKRKFTNKVKLSSFLLPLNQPTKKVFVSIKKQLKWNKPAFLQCKGTIVAPIVVFCRK